MSHMAAASQALTAAAERELLAAAERAETEQVELRREAEEHADAARRARATALAERQARAALEERVQQACMSAELQRLSGFGVGTTSALPPAPPTPGHPQPGGQGGQRSLSRSALQSSLLRSPVAPRAQQPQPQVRAGGGADALIARAKERAREQMSFGWSITPGQRNPAALAHTTATAGGGSSGGTADELRRQLERDIAERKRAMVAAMSGSA